MYKNKSRRDFIRMSTVFAAASSISPSVYSTQTNDISDKIQTGICHLTQEQMAGPYIRRDSKTRRNITENEPGIPLLIKLSLIDINTCKPLENHHIDIWHCNARGGYSGWHYIDPDREAPSGEISSITRTDESTYLRGTQCTDSNGCARFTTIYPGFYAGRAVHIHISVKTPKEKSEDVDRFLYIGQAYFPDDISDEVFKTNQYANRNIKRLLNTDDEVFSQLKAPYPVFLMRKTNNQDIDDGLFAELIITVNSKKLSNKITEKEIIKLS